MNCFESLGLFNCKNEIMSLNGTYSFLQIFSNMETLANFVKGVPPIVFTLFLGAWSDSFGRKALVTLPLTGFIFYNGWFLTNALFFDQMSADWLMLEVFEWLPGGYMCLFLGFYSYVTDHSSPEHRTARLSIVDCSVHIGTLVGLSRMYLRLICSGFSLLLLNLN